MYSSILILGFDIKIMKQFVLPFAILALVACISQPASSFTTSTNQPGTITTSSSPQIATNRSFTSTTAALATQEKPVTPTVTPLTPTSLPVTSPSAYQPQPGDSKLQSEEIDADTVAVESSSGKNTFSVLSINGSLPTPCHQPRVVVSLPDSKNRINIKLYSVVNPELMCAQVITSFNIFIQLDQLKQSGEYIIVVNNQEMARFLWQ
jgi:hypothetical protein